MTTLSALPDAPLRTDPATFASRSDAFLGAIETTFRTELNTIVGEINTAVETATTQAGLATTNGAHQVDLAATQAGLATTNGAHQVDLAAAQVALATTQAGNAANSATAAASSALAAGAVPWVSGQTYALGASATSLIDFQTYRRSVAGAGTTDPKNDGTNWVKVSAGGISAVVTATGNTTLTSSPTLLSITPASYGVVVTLPNATTCALGGPLHKIDNRGVFAVIVKNASGTVVGYVGAGRSEDVFLANNSASAGVWSIGGQYGLCQLSSVSASTSAAVDFTGIDGFFDAYEIHLSNVKLSANNLSLILQVSLNGGSTWQTTNCASAGEGYTSGSAYVAGGSTTTVFLNLDTARIYSDGHGYSGVVTVMRPRIAGYVTSLVLAAYESSGSAQTAIHGSGRISAASPVNAFRILPTSGTILSGSVKLFGKGV